MNITKDSIIKDVITEHPNVAKVLMKNNIHCLSCAITINESINVAASKNHVNIDELMNEIYQSLEETKG